MAGRIGRYTYKNESVLKEFFKVLFGKLGASKRRKIEKDMRKDPEMRKLLDKLEKRNKEAIKRMKAKRDSNPNYDSYLKSIGE
jgi:anti-sigma-K factor RskA|tara:strand:+ start:119 stop:367 length:249 start_codon:yes stop_codon:yes gene_type:complete